MRKIKIINRIFGLLIIVATSCIDEPDEQGILNPHVPVGSDAELYITSPGDLWIYPDFPTTTFSLTGKSLDDIQTLTMQAVFNSAAGNVIEPVDLMEISNITALADTVDFTVEGSAMLSALGLSVEDVEPGDRFEILFKNSINGKTFLNRDSHGILVSCPSDIPTGTFTAKSGASSTDSCPSGVGGLSYDVTITSLGAGQYTISDFWAGAYQELYCDCYGYCFETGGTFLDVCGNLSMTITDAFGSTNNATGMYDNDTGLISISWTNGFGDNGSYEIATR